MYILDPLGTAAEDLFRNSVTLVARSKAGLGGCICSTPITQGVAGWGGRYYIRELGLLVVRGRRGYIILSADHHLDDPCKHIPWPLSEFALG